MIAWSAIAAAGPARDVRWGPVAVSFVLDDRPRRDATALGARGARASRSALLDGGSKRSHDHRTHRNAWAAADQYPRCMPSTNAVLRSGERALPDRAGIRGGCGASACPSLPSALDRLARDVVPGNASATSRAVQRRHHAADDRDAERTADLARGVVHRRADAGLGQRQRAHDRLGGRRHREPMPTPSASCATRRRPSTRCSRRRASRTTEADAGERQPGPTTTLVPSARRSALLGATTIIVSAIGNSARRPRAACSRARTASTASAGRSTRTSRRRSA